MTLICTKTWRAHLYQRFRYAPSGRQYVFTQTKRGKTTVYQLQGCRTVKPGVLHEVWFKCDADESAVAINELAVMYDRHPEFMQFFGQK